MQMRVRRIQALPFVLVALVSAATARAQTLAVQGNHFAIDGQGKFLLFASYFDAMHASSQTLDTDFQYLREKGFDGIRIFPNWAQGLRRAGRGPGVLHGDRGRPGQRSVVDQVHRHPQSRPQTTASSST